MTSTRQHLKRMHAWQNKYDVQAPKPGVVAPDFQLFDTSGKNPVCLSDYIGQKPVALVFGGFTWPPYVKGTGSLQDLYWKYSDQVKFIKIYIREAHPVDGWWLGKGLSGLMIKYYSPQVATNITDPKTIEERRAVASDCEQALEYGIKTYVDEIDDRVNKAYAALPTRLYLINIDGLIEYAGGLGPYGFKPGEFGRAINDYLTNKN